MTNQFIFYWYLVLLLRRSCNNQTALNHKSISAVLSFSTAEIYFHRNILVKKLHQSYMKHITILSVVF